MSLCESCIRNKDCEWNKGNPRHCTLYTDKEETNFERITKSPEALAEFISSLPVDVPPCEICIRCHKCIYDKQCEKGSYPTDNEIWLAWLKQESDSE